ncbi:MAG: hypothetical protein WCV80_03195 [Candidatus Paceibacterota bacterium]
MQRNILRGLFVMIGIFCFDSCITMSQGANQKQCEAQTICVPPLTHEVWVTAYTSDSAECDDTPFITASGSRTRDGIVACNFLPFGTKIKIPELFGDKEFIVEDRMAKRKHNYVDVWIQEKIVALSLGKTRSYIEIIHL